MLYTIYPIPIGLYFRNIQAINETAEIFWQYSCQFHIINVEIFTLITTSLCKFKELARW